MTELWDRLDAIQQKSLSGLGSDLNSVRRGGISAPLGPRLGDVSTEDRRVLDEARDSFRLASVAAPSSRLWPSLSTIDLAQLRAEIWSILGPPQIAGVFHKFIRVNLPSPADHQPLATT